MTNYSWWFVRS